MAEKYCNATRYAMYVTRSRNHFAVETQGIQCVVVFVVEPHVTVNYVKILSAARFL